jgi:phage baseplate assembly protein W
MAKDFLGAGWKFPLRVDPTGRIVLSRQEEDIKEAIWIILSTAKGERAMRPEFGCGIHDLAFAPNNPATRNLVETTVREALNTFEDRIEILNLNVSGDEADTGKLMISLDYQVKSTNGRFNLVFPFYLKEGTE